MKAIIYVHCANGHYLGRMEIEKTDTAEKLMEQIDKFIFAHKKAIVDSI